MMSKMMDTLHSHCVMHLTDRLHLLCLFSWLFLRIYIVNIFFTVTMFPLNSEVTSDLTCSAYNV